MRSLACLLRAAADRSPDSLALVGTDRSHSWSDLEHRTAALAAYLGDHGIVRGDRVAILRPKSEASFEATHAVLRAAAVVVPIDPTAPPAVARAILADAGVRAVIGDEATVRRVEPSTVPGLDLAAVACTDVSPASDEEVPPVDLDSMNNIDSINDIDSIEDIVANASSSIDLREPSPDDPAYIIFTSGSTGTPKGIVHTHASGLAYAELAVATHGLRSDDRVGAMCPLHFDMSTLELYAAPLVGATVVAMSEAHLRFPASLVERSADERVTVWYAVPFQLRQMLERGGIAQRDLSALRLVIYAGEPYDPGALGDLMAALPQAAVVNAYGPAEVNVCTTFDVEHPPADAQPIPIGRPWGDVGVKVVGDTGPVAAGEPGELLVATETMMLGYWNRPELTTHSIEIDENGTRWYRTGDVVRQRADGVLEFRGRSDHQVKIRGTRLELDAIEAILAEAPGVAYAVVAPVAAADRVAATHLGAVVVGDGTVGLDGRELRRWCGSRMASVAVPQHVEVWDSLPSTSSGKVDRATVRSHICGQPEPTTSLIPPLDLHTPTPEEKLNR